MNGLIKKLQKDTEEIKTLQRIIPICTSCKKIRDGKRYWKHIETYIRENYHTEFIHSICPECAKKYIWNLFNGAVRDEDFLT
jgi:hypothetical protein